MTSKYTKVPQNRPNDHKIYQRLPLQDPPKFTQICIFGLKMHHLATPGGSRRYTVICFVQITMLIAEQSLPVTRARSQALMNIMDRKREKRVIKFPCVRIQKPVCS
jgi:hypothetical protein